MRRIGIVTDSSSDLPADLARKRGISIVPLTVRFGSETFVDRVDLTTERFWARLGTPGDLPETAAPSPGVFLDVFEAAEKMEGVVCVCLSSRLSGTYQAAVIAAEEADVPVAVIDSGVVSMALGLSVMAAADVADTGDDLDGVAEAAAGAAARANVYAALDTLEFLERGGRIGRVSALVGGLLDIKPLITLEDGVVGAAGRVRTRAKAAAAVVDHVRRRSISDVAVLFSGEAPVDELLAALAGVGANEPTVAELGPVVGTHTGPGVIGVAYLEG